MTNLSTSGIAKADVELLSNFRHQLRTFLSSSEMICRAYDLTPLQYQLLLHIRGVSTEDELLISELASRLQITRSGIVTLVDRCARLGLVERFSNTCEGGKVSVRLLPKGLQLIDLLASLHNQEFQLLREIFTLPECAKFCTSPVCWKSTD